MYISLQYSVWEVRKHTKVLCMPSTMAVSGKHAGSDPFELVHYSPLDCIYTVTFKSISLLWMDLFPSSALWNSVPWSFGKYQFTELHNSSKFWLTELKRVQVDHLQNFYRIAKRMSKRIWKAYESALAFSSYTFVWGQIFSIYMTEQSNTTDGKSELTQEPQLSSSGKHWAEKAQIL